MRHHLRSEYAANLALARHDAATVFEPIHQRNRQVVQAAWAAKRAREARSERIARAVFCTIAAAMLPAIFIAATSGV